MNWRLILLPALAAFPQIARAETICTDRPTKANAVCTVPPGTVQVETSLVGWSLAKSAGSRSELLTLGSSFAKIGLSANSDLQFGITPLARLTVRQDGGRHRVSGFGDVVVRYKRRLTNSDGAIHVGIIPFVKLPTASDGLGNGKVEGGLAVPISLAAGKATVTLGPEADWLADGDGSGHHLAIVNLVNVAVPVADRLTMIGELWSNYNLDPDGTVEQFSADAALAYAISDDVQLDAGANVGLSHETPDVELSVGASVRF